MWVGAAGRGDRHSLGALCPSVSMVSGAGDHNTGDTLRRDPAWETAFTLVAPAPAAPWTPSFPRVMEAAMTPRKDNFPEPNRRRRARLEVKNPDAAGIDVGAEAMALPEGCEGGGSDREALAAVGGIGERIAFEGGIEEAVDEEFALVRRRVLEEGAGVVGGGDGAGEVEVDAAQELRVGGERRGALGEIALGRGQRLVDALVQRRFAAGRGGGEEQHEAPNGPCPGKETRRLHAARLAVRRRLR